MAFIQVNHWKNTQINSQGAAPKQPFLGRLPYVSSSSKYFSQILHVWYICLHLAYICIRQELVGTNHQYYRSYGSYKYGSLAALAPFFHLRFGAGHLSFSHFHLPIWFTDNVPKTVVRRRLGRLQSWKLWNWDDIFAPIIIFHRTALFPATGPRTQPAAVSDCETCQRNGTSNEILTFWCKPIYPWNKGTLPSATFLRWDPVRSL